MKPQLIKFQRFCGIPSYLRIKADRGTYTKRVIEYGYLYMIFLENTMLGKTGYLKGVRISVKIEGATKKEAIYNFKQQYETIEISTING